MYLEDPGEIYFDEVGDACVSAAFTIRGMQLRSRGQVIVTQCERCSEEHCVLQMEDSEQRFHLSETIDAWDEPRAFTAKIQDWVELAPTLELLPPE